MKPKCRCGCGQATSIAKRNRKEWGHVKGQPVPYVRGHQSGRKAPGGKQCPRCERTLPLSEFAPRPARGPEHRQSYCRQCANQWKVDNREPYQPQTPEEKAQLNRANVRRWRANNPDKKRLQGIRDYLRRRGAPLTGESRHYAESILPGDPCSYCGELRGYTMDHIDAVSAGGDSHWENLTAACLSCNSGKGAKPLLQYMLHKRNEIVT